MKLIYGSVNATVCDEELVVVMEPDYLMRFVPLIQATPRRVIANYIHWRLVMEFGGEASWEISNFQRKFGQNLKGLSPFQQRSAHLSISSSIC